MLVRSFCVATSKSALSVVDDRRAADRESAESAAVLVISLRKADSAIPAWGDVVLIGLCGICT